MRVNTILAGIVVILLLALPAAASDYTLAIFGNANEDDTINMQDVTYTELIILEYRDETELADGKHDEKINMRDVTQIELVIPGKEKELTMIDDSGRIVTVNKPITRIVALNYCLSELLVVIGAKDEIVGVESRFKTRMKDIAEAWDLMEVQTVGTYKSSDYEQVLELKPDIIITVPGLIELKGSSLFRVGSWKSR